MKTCMMGRNFIRMGFVTIILPVVSSCETERQSGVGLYLPRGEAEAGRRVYMDYGCYRCHSIRGLSLPIVRNKTPLINYQLGGDVAHVKTYGELLTAVINPTHVISGRYINMLEQVAEPADVVTPMLDYNGSMTVTELIDLITFLDSTYRKIEPQYSGYSYTYGHPAEVM